MVDLIRLIPAFLTMAGCSPDITPDTVSAIIQVESSGDQSVVSDWGAYGLMQVTEIAVEDYNRRRGTSINIKEIADEPVINLIVGIDHLCQWQDLDKQGKVIAYFTGRRRYLEMMRGEADYLIKIAKRYYREVEFHEHGNQVAGKLDRDLW